MSWVQVCIMFMLSVTLYMVCDIGLQMSEEANPQPDLYYCEPTPQFVVFVGNPQLGMVYDCTDHLKDDGKGKNHG